MMNYDIPPQHSQPPVGFVPGRIPWQALVQAFASDPRYNIDGQPFSLGDDFPVQWADQRGYGFMMQPGRPANVSALAVHQGFRAVPGNAQDMARTGTPDNTAVFWPEHFGANGGPNAAAWRDRIRHELSHLIMRENGVKGASDDPFNEKDAYAYGDGRKRFETK